MRWEAVASREHELTLRLALEHNRRGRSARVDRDRGEPPRVVVEIVEPVTRGLLVVRAVPAPLFLQAEIALKTQRQFRDLSLCAGPD